MEILKSHGKNDPALRISTFQHESLRERKCRKICLGVSFFKRKKRKWGNNGATSLMFLEGECGTGGVGVDPLKTSETCTSLIDKLRNAPIRGHVYQETPPFLIEVQAWA